MITFALVLLVLTPMPVGDPSSQAESGKSTHVQLFTGATIGVTPESAAPASAPASASTPASAAAAASGKATPLSERSTVSSVQATAKISRPSAAHLISAPRETPA